jgi:hypothetical protein
MSSRIKRYIPFRHSEAAAARRISEKVAAQKLTPTKTESKKPSAPQAPDAPVEGVKENPYDRLLRKVATDQQK